MARARLLAGSPLHSEREASLVAILLLLVVAAALAPTLNAGFVFDDRADAIENPAASPGGFLPALGRTNRPLVKASYALQRFATGDSSRPFHAANLGLHLLTTLLVLAFARRLAARAGLARPHLVGALAAALWALHPAVVETVAPVTGRSLLLATPAMLAALLLVTGEAPPPRSASIAAFGLAVAATAARETALVLPALALAWQATLGAGEDRPTALRRQLPLLAGALLGVGGLALSARHRELVAFSLETRTPLEALRGNLFALPEILRMAVEPARISIDPTTMPDLPWTDPATQLRLAALVGAGALGWLLRRRAPLAALSLLWALLALAPTNSVVWRLDPVSARPLYLASIAPLAALVTAFVAWAARRAAPTGRWLPAAAAVTLLTLAPVAALAARSHARATLYTDPVALWADATSKAPENPRSWTNLGVELMIADRLDEAERALRHALALEPGNGGLLCALDSIHIRRRTLALENRSRP